MVEIRRGPNNFFDLVVLLDLADRLEGLTSDGRTRAVVLCSEGKNFCAGADFTARTRSTVADDGAPHLSAIALRLFGQPVPMVAAVQGAAIGGGLGLTMVADFRVASSESRLSATFAQLGFHHGFGRSVTLPRVIGEEEAAELLPTGRRIHGEAAHRMGLCDVLTSADEIRARPSELAAEIASAAPLAVRSIRATLRAGLVDRLRDAMGHERQEQERLQGTADFRERVAAARERRAAMFEGR